MGITSPLFPDENTSSGRFVGHGTRFDSVADPEDDGVDIVAFADFMRATKAPPRGRVSTDARSGAQLFASIGCETCVGTASRSTRAGSTTRLSRPARTASSANISDPAARVARWRSRTSRSSRP
jgi:hypothetical protein